MMYLLVCYAGLYISSLGKAKDYEMRIQTKENVPEPRNACEYIIVMRSEFGIMPTFHTCCPVSPSGCRRSDMSLYPVGINARLYNPVCITATIEYFLSPRHF
jgi:hypothetical protein